MKSTLLATTLTTEFYAKTGGAVFNAGCEALGDWSTCKRLTVSAPAGGGKTSFSYALMMAVTRNAESNTRMALSGGRVAGSKDLRTAQDRLVQTQKLASLGQLTAGIAHEIKNPLNFVNNFSGVSAELIDELREALGRMTGDDKTRREIAELTDTLRDNLDKIVQHGKRADAIVKNMLLHSREGSGEHRLVNVNALVEESLNLAYHGARAEKPGFKINMEQSFDPAAGRRGPS